MDNFVLALCSVLTSGQRAFFGVSLGTIVVMNGEFDTCGVRGSCRLFLNRPDLSVCRKPDCVMKVEQRLEMPFLSKLGKNGRGTVTVNGWHEVSRSAALGPQVCSLGRGVTEDHVSGRPPSPLQQRPERSIPDCDQHRKRNTLRNLLGA